MKRRSIWGYLLRKIRRRIPLFLLLIAANAAVALLGVAFALGSEAVIDSAVARDWELFKLACLKQIAIIIGIILCLTLSRLLTGHLPLVIDKDMKKSLLGGLLNGEYSKVSAYHSGELVNRLSNDVRMVHDGIVSVFPGLASMIVKLSAVIVTLTIIDWRFCVVIGAAGVMVVIATAFARRKLGTLNKRVNECEGRVSGYIQEVLEKLMAVQAMDVSQEVEKRADGLLDERYAYQRRRRNISVLSSTCVTVFIRVSGFAALIWCSVGIINGTMSVGELTAVTQLVSQLQTPFVNISGVFPKYIAMVASLERLMELEEICGDSVQDKKADTAAIYDNMTDIRADSLVFSYGRDIILNNIDFTIKKNSFTVIMGHSGIGKSTVLKLMLGIFCPAGGKLAVNAGGEEIPLDRTTRGLFAYVPQGNLLFSGTIRDNLILTCPNATDEEIQKAVYVSCMDEFLPTLPDGLDTQLGENSGGLSEGQAQRIAIARAVLGGAPILLLDEATSALDAKTEKLVLERICELPCRTCIAVTHRPAALALADTVLEFENGAVNQK